MHINRAREIIDADENIEVLYNGSSVWLDDVNTEESIAHVIVLENRARMDVSLVDLVETGRELK